MDIANLAPELKAQLEGVRDASVKAAAEQKEALKQNEEKFGKAVADLKSAFEQQLGELKKNGVADPETKEKIDRLETHINTVEALVLRGGSKSGHGGEVKTIGEHLTAREDFTAWHKSQFTSDKTKRFPVEGGSFIQNEKAIITDSGVGSGTSGVLMPQRRAGIVGLPQRNLRIRDLLNIIPMSGPGNSIDFVKENVLTNRASPQTESVSKAESELTFTTDSCTVRTLAHHINVSRQALDDVAGLRQRLDINLMYGLKLVEEYELLSGSGTGEHLKGITVQATAYAGTYNATGDTKLDRLRHAILEARMALYPVDGIILHPKDAHDIELIKTEEGGANKGVYIVGDPRTGQEILTVWGKPVVESDSIAPGQFCVGAFAMGAEVYDRMAAVIEISFEHDQNFTRNLATLLAEERLALAVIRPKSFVQGVF